MFYLVKVAREDLKKGFGKLWVTQRVSGNASGHRWQMWAMLAVG